MKMEVYLANYSTGYAFKNEDIIFVGNTKLGCVIPKIGERIFLNYSPPEKVVDVIYNYKENVIFVIVDGYLKNYE
jgi:hypothetical protein